MPSGIRMVLTDGLEGTQTGPGEVTVGIRSNLLSPEPLAYEDFRPKANGAAVAADTGQTWTHSGEDSLEIISGKLTNNDATGTSTGYAVLDLGAPVTHIGARFTLGTHSTDGGAIGIIVWQTAMGVVIPNSPLHLSIGYHSMTLGFWTSPSTLTQLATPVIFTNDLVADREYTVDATIRGDTVEVVLSNGATVSGSHANVAAFAGNFACWEVIQNDAATDAKGKFVEIWADTAVRSDTADRSRQLSKFDIATMAPRASSKTYAAAVSTPLVINLTSTAFDASLNITTVYPPSGQIYVGIEYFAVNVGDAVILQYIKGEFVQVSTKAGSEYINAGKVMSGTPGAADTFTFGAIRFGGTSFTVQQSAASGFLVTSRAIPL